MKGDFTRFTWDPKKRFDSVRMQQGRVQVDADWNEQLDIESHRRETALRDVIGGCCAPAGGEAGFEIGLAEGDADLTISAGRLYVDGILCEQPDESLTYLAQEDLPDAQIPEVVDPTTFLVYLDVWKWHLTALEDPEIRETALGGPDTATRLKTVCQVKLLQVPAGSACGDVGVVEPDRGTLEARTRPETDPSTPCVVPATAGYTRLENQLYRVEVHEEGTLGAATFKWSRNNGAIVTDWLEQNGNELTVRSTGQDDLLGFHDARWVELIDDDRELRGEPGLLVEVVNVDGDVIEIDPGGHTVDLTTFGEHPKLRRWDMTGDDGAETIEVAVDNDGYLALESGVQVRFGAGTYCTGDYWVIPARAFIGEFAGDIEWPTDETSGDPLALPPHGIEHHYCNLALVDWDGTSFGTPANCRHFFDPLCGAVDSGGCCTVMVEPGESIQNALDELGADGGCVCLKTGLHEISGTILIQQSNVIVHGESPGTVVRGEVLPLVRIRGSRIEIHDVRFETTAEAEGPVPAIISLERSERVALRRCGVAVEELSDLTGVSVFACFDVHIGGCEIVNVLVGLWAAQNSLSIEAIDNRIGAERAEGLDQGFAGIHLERVSNACRVEHNEISGFVVGVAVSDDPLSDSPTSFASGTVVTANRIRRESVDGERVGEHLYGIDVAARDCSVAGNVLSLGSSLYGGIRISASNAAVERNRILSTAQEPSGDRLPIGILVGSEEADGPPADSCVIAGNDLDGLMDAIVVERSTLPEVGGNSIGVAGGGIRTGILFAEVDDGRASGNQVVGADVAVQLDGGSDNVASGNVIREGRLGVVMEGETGLAISDNRISGTGGPAVQAVSWVGTLNIASNRITSCGWQGTPVSVAALFGFGELAIDGCEILHTGLSPVDGSAAAPAFGILGLLVLQATVQNNTVAAAAFETDDSGNIAGVDLTAEHRSLFLMGLYELQLTDTATLGFPAQIQDNRFAGPGRSALVQVFGFSVNDRFHLRFDRVAFSNNDCWHWTFNEAAAMVVIDAGTASAVGNLFRSLATPLTTVDFRSTPGLYLGNAGRATTGPDGSSIRPPAADLQNFNRN